MEGGRKDYLDGLRGLAAFLVVFHHAACIFYPWMVFGGSHPVHAPFEWLFGRTPLYFFFSGELMVYIFFVLSGFVLSRSFFLRPTRSTLNAIVKRHMRLAFPCLIASLIAVVLISARLYQTQDLILATGSFSWLTFSSPTQVNVLYAAYLAFFGIFGSPLNSTYNIVIWTMFYEYLGSMLVYLLVPVVANFRARGVIYALAVAILWNTLLLPFILGMILSDVYCYVPRRPVRWWTKCLWLAVFLLGTLVGSIPATQDILPSYYNWIKLIGTSPSVLLGLRIFGATCVVAAVVYLSSFQRFFTWRPFLWLGRISFSLYLLHVPILLSFGSYVFLSIVGKVGYNHAVVYTVGITFCLLIPLSYIFYRLIDLTALRIAAMVPDVLNKYTFLHLRDSK